MEPVGSTLPHTDGRARKAGAPTPRPHLFLALECDRPLAPPARWSLGDLESVTIGRGNERGASVNNEGGARRLLVRVPDRWMSSTHVQLHKVLGRWVLEDASSKNGTIVNGAKVHNTPLSDGDVVELGRTFFVYRDAMPLGPDDPPMVDGARAPLDAPAPGLATLLPPYGRELAMLAHVASSTVSVVLRGESGTGKEVVARAVHQLSGRAGAFVAVNCGALPETLVETELFGYRKGAFSGATEDRVGLVRSAERGTLFLDEIGDLPAASQAAFLRVLQEREVTPVGATRPVPVDVRLVAATHRDLDALVDEGHFRADLLARISGFTLLLPPLRQRREDLGILVAALLRRVAPDGAAGVTLTCEAVRAFFRHGWPLNVRELEKSLGTAVVLARGGPIEVEHLPPAVRAALEGPDRRSDAVGPDGQSTLRPLTPDEQRHKDELVALLQQHGGNISAVARALGKARMQIQRWVKRYGLEPESYRR